MSCIIFSVLRSILNCTRIFIFISSCLPCGLELHYCLFLLLIFPPLSSFASSILMKLLLRREKDCLWDYDKILGCALEGVCSRMQTFSLSFNGFPLLVIVLEHWNVAQAELICKIICCTHLFWNHDFSIMHLIS